MKILFIVTQSEFGGAQRFVFEAAGYFAEQGNEVIIMSGEGDEALPLKISNLKSKNLNLNLKSKNLRQLKRVPGLFNGFLAVREITNLLKQERPGVLFLCSTTAGILGSVAASIYKKRFQVSGFKFQVIYRIGGWAFRDPRAWWQNKIILWLEKLTTRFKDKIIVNSEIDRELALKYKICAPEKIVKIHNGVDINRLEFLPNDQAAAYLGINCPQGKTIGCVANFYKTKGLEYLIEAIKILGAEHKIQDVAFVIIGDGTEREKLETQIKGSGIKNKIFLTGRLPNARKYLAAFDIFVLPSIKEGFPWALLEAMTAKLPVIVTNVGAAPEIIEDGKNGFVVEPRKPELFAQKIKELIGDEHLRHELGIQAHQTVVLKFDLNKMVEKVEVLL